MTIHRWSFRSVLLASIFGLSGCATFSPDNGMTVVSDIAGQTIKKDIAFVRSAEDAEQARDAVKRLLSRMLTVDAAVQVALLNNKGLQAAYNELALAEAELVQQSLPPNPVFSISRISGDGASEIERQVVGDILALATLAPTMDKAVMQPPLHPTSGPDYRPVVTLNGWSLPWRMNDDWKEFHLVAEPVVREFAEGMKVNLWGYNGQAPGPTIEAVEGDKVRIFVTNKLPEHTTVHWHGMIVPNGTDGVGGLNQPHIPPGKTFVYEFELKKSGTFMYHPHSDEMVQMAMGMMGMFIVHPRDPSFRPVDRDFVFIMSSYLIDPGTYLPKVNEMTDFNMWTFNSRVFPGIDPMPVRLGDRVRVRVGNLTMTNHPIHLHGHSFSVSCTDGGWVPESAQWPEVTIDVPVGAIRAFEVVAENPGDWAFHCHKSHHTMNAMGHNTRNFIGADPKALAKASRTL